MFSAKSNQNINVLLEFIKKQAPPKFLTVGSWTMIVGVPNAGKSSIINAFRTKSSENFSIHYIESSAKTGPLPCVTRGVSGYRISTNPLMYILDTPGISIPNIEKPEQAMKLALTGAIKDDIVGVDVLCDYLLYILNKLHILQYVKQYSLNQPTDSLDVILTHLKYIYNWDEISICRVILKHYREGRLGKFTLDKINEASF